VKALALAIALVLCAAGTAGAATLEPVGVFEKPTFVSSDPADPNRLLVVELDGRVMEARSGAVAELADLTEFVKCCTSERGLLSIAPAPDFATSGRFYAAYTGKVAAGGAEGDIHVDAFRQAGGALLREPILAVGHADHANHNGGQLQFGPDGYLYVSTGDGGGGGDPLESGQNLGTLLGKVLRIDPRPGQTPAYTIPPGNPFAAGGGLAEIWSYGLRNPWRFSFDRLSGDMVIADVGQGMREEVDFAPSPAAGVVGGAGANYGWNCREGTIAYLSAPESCEGAGGFTDPVFDYPHTDPEDGSAHGCAITGGYVARDPSIPELYGRYVYADFCVGEIRSLVLPASAGAPAGDDRSEGLSVASPSSFGEDSCGRLYVTAIGGVVYRLAGATPASCPSPAPAGPPAPGPSAQHPPDSSASAGSERARVRLGKRSRSRGDDLKLVLTARASPCPEQAGDRVQLNRGGKRLAGKRLNGRCLARFSLRVDRRSTFRALLPASGYRSQVLTIALAKPRP
jgi:hypothetical protein